jgi:hypothetical protein
MRSNLVGSNPQKDTYHDPPRVGDLKEIWDTKRDPIARKGFVKSNLPTLVGVNGLGSLNHSLLQIPIESHKHHPTHNLHPTYLSKQQNQCLDDGKVHEILSALRNQSHRPSLRFVQQGQGTARELARVSELEARERQRQTRYAFVNRALYSPIKQARKRVVDSSKFVSGGD